MTPSKPPLNHLFNHPISQPPYFSTHPPTLSTSGPPRVDDTRRSYRDDLLAGGSIGTMGYPGRRSYLSGGPLDERGGSSFFRGAYAPRGTHPHTKKPVCDLSTSTQSITYPLHALIAHPTHSITYLLNPPSNNPPLNPPSNNYPLHPPSPPTLSTHPAAVPRFPLFLLLGRWSTRQWRSAGGRGGHLGVLPRVSTGSIGSSAAHFRSACVGIR